MDINIRMGTSIMRAYLKGLGTGIDGGWLGHMPRTTLLTGVRLALILLAGTHARHAMFTARRSLLPGSLHANHADRSSVTLIPETVA